ncbi:carbohydrate ABC transporter permease [Clostridium swellfunianum]|uniref:carbohydrate ABC transporter permease n=1 Tax=Clostridium swellfunianum TaxID=1367462 RepID=UPI0020300C2A|nr:carbohydrate ABC transporter permease [Clostridium swellfunianum]MCM0650091.1 carbohydrate ABC transporter permease [Clostridium swellfunianum]
MKIKKLNKSSLLVGLSLAVFSFIMVGPFIWMFITSVKTYEETIRIPMQILPKAIKWINYKIVFEKFPFIILYLNTFLVTIATVAGQLIIVSLAAYAFSRLNFPGRDIIFLLMLGFMMVPGQIFIIPRFNLMVNLGITNTLTALVLPSIFSVFGVFMMKQFFSTIPKELDEAALIDGCGYFRIFWNILLPLTKPGLVSLGIMIMLSTWKELMWPIIVNRNIEKMTLSAGLAMLIGEHTTYYEQVMAGAVISVLPMVIIFVIFQKQFVAGIARSGLKG